MARYRALAPPAPAQHLPGERQQGGGGTVKGTIGGLSAEEIVIEREDARVGPVDVHLPRLGYRVQPG